MKPFFFLLTYLRRENGWYIFFSRSVSHQYMSPDFWDDSDIVEECTSSCKRGNIYISDDHTGLFISHNLIISEKIMYEFECGARGMKEERIRLRGDVLWGNVEMLFLWIYKHRPVSLFMLMWSTIDSRDRSLWLWMWVVIFSFSPSPYICYHKTRFFFL